jgi:NitT/TauT family transport system permease protein
MAFSVYQSLRSVPPELEEVARSFRLSPLHRFFRLDLPATIPGLVWNMMMSMSGGWFFIVAAEAITVGNTSVALPGVGSWLALAIARQDLGAVGWAVAAMATIIALYDQLLFRPLVAFADRFRADDTPGAHRPKSWAYELLLRTRLVPLLFRPLGRALFRLCLRLQPAPASDSARRRQQRRRDQREWMWRGVLAMIGLGSLVIVGAYVREQLNLAGVAGLFMLACFTLARVLVLIALASLIWVPAGVWIGLRPVWAARLQPVAQFLAAFPANILFPVAVAAIVHLHLDANVWLSPLMVLGTQWYILFNVIAGASLIPQDLLDVARLAGLDGWRWWTRLALPAVFPYYVTGALTASGGSWNASIVAELVNWGDVRLKAAGLGSFIAEATAAGDYHQVALGIAMMALFVIGLNQLLWRPLYRLAERRLRPPA